MAQESLKDLLEQEKLKNQVNQQTIWKLNRLKQLTILIEDYEWECLNLGEKIKELNHERNTIARELEGLENA